MVVPAPAAAELPVQHVRQCCSLMHLVTDAYTSGHHHNLQMTLSKWLSVQLQNLCASHVHAPDHLTVNMAYVELVEQVRTRQ